MPDLWAYESGHADFCERNYAWSPYVAEWWNALSSLGMVVVAVAGLRAARRVGGAGWSSALFVALAVTGLGSFAFHATLSWAGQMLDQTPMLFVVLGLLYALVSVDEALPRPLVRALPALLAGFLLAAGSWMLFVATTPTFFRVTFGAVVVLVIVQEVRLCARYAAPELRRTYFKGLGLFALAFALWSFEQRYCGSVVEQLPANPHLHAYWHMLCAVSCYNTFMWLTAIHLGQQRAAGKVSLVEEWGGMLVTVV